MHSKRDQILWTRRRALGALAGSAAATLCGPSALASLAGFPGAGRSPKKLVLLWLAGGPSQFETFDPKPGTSAGGPTRTVATDVDGWTFAESLPRLARRAEHLCVIRSMTSREGSHSRARYFVQTGYVQNPTVNFPTVGSIVSAEIGDQDADLPSYVQVGGTPSGGGYLGIEHAPLAIATPGKDIDHVEYPRGVSPTRMNSRLKMLDVIEQQFEKTGGQQAVAANRSLRKRARRLMDTKLRIAFDLDGEKERLRDEYGRHPFGQGCLLARRLLKAGVSVVEVVLSGWDTHQDNFARTAKLNAQLDSGFSSLMDDLRRHGLYDDTLVACMGEFGRTPRITTADGRGHWPASWCAALSGGGLKTGQALGRTDEKGERIVERPVTVPDLFATFSKVLNFDPDRESIVQNRPVTLVDPEGRIVREILRPV